MSPRESPFRRLGKAFVGASKAMLNHETPRDAAAISYFSLIALFPSILVMVALTDAVLNRVDLHKRVVRIIVALFPGSSQFLRVYLSEVTTPSVALTISCVAVILWSTSWIFTFIENALNRAWGVPNRRSFWESRMRSISLMVLGGACLLISAGITLVVSRWQSLSSGRIPEFAEDPIIKWLWSSVMMSMGFVVAIIVFSLVFKLMPDRKVPWIEAFSGALVATIMWEIASYVFAWLVPSFDYQKIYGKTYTIILLLVWVYTSSFIMLYGANFSAHLHRSDVTRDVLPLPGESGQESYRNKIRSFRRPR
ncbi:MAG TPA: YihY/virulence factor BrkB family protein [Acidobacteriota bacterium]|nr:YihY/virulence factor BrkB family protein [Acidobacteriota bacterium]